MLFQIGCKIALIKLKTDFDRQPTLSRKIRVLIGADTIGKPKIGDLPPIGFSRETKASGRREAAPRQRRKICGLRTDAVSVGRCGMVERDDVSAHGRSLRPDGRGLYFT